MSVKPKITPMLTSELAPIVSESFYAFGTKKTFQAHGFTSAGAGAAEVSIQASNDLAIPFVEIGVISLVLGTTPIAEGFASDASWLYFKAEVNSISGTDAEVSVNMGSIGHS